MLAAGAEVDAKDEKGVTALMHASAEGHTQSVEALLDAGADVDAQASDGLTALMVVARGNAQIVRTLLDAGAQVDAKADSGVTALMLTERNGYIEIAELLKSAGAIVTEPRRPQETLLANELSAINTVRDIVVAQITYSVTDGEGNFAKNLPELTEAALIASELATGMQNGYQFATSGEGETFTVRADPILPGETGTRHFFADETGVIRWSMEGPATVFSPGFRESAPEAE